MPAIAPAIISSSTTNKSSETPEKKYKCQFCCRAFSRSEHRSRHERSHTKERPFKCLKCRSTFVRRDLLLRHDRTVHASDGGVPLHSDGKRRKAAVKSIAIDSTTLEQIEASSDGMVDLETAAMLMTDLHHKATAAMRSAGIHDYGNSNDSSLVFKQSTSPIIDDKASFHSSTISLPQMQWASFSKQSTTEPRAHSLASTFSTSRGTQRHHAISDPSEFQPHANTLPPIMHQSASTCNGLVPALQTMIDSLPKLASTSPGRTTPGLLCDVNLHRMHLKSDDERNTILHNIHSADKEGGIPASFRLPSMSSINTYLTTYFEKFHHHLPFLHPASFTPTSCSPALLLAVLSVGALCSCDQASAFTLHIGAKILVTQFLCNKANFSSRKCPLWTMQSSLLNMMFSSWSGDPKGLEWACSIKSLLANMVAGNKYEFKLRTEARRGMLPSQTEWVEDEGCRRTYYAVYIFFGLLTLTYNHTPAINFNEFEDLHLPSTENFWEASANVQEENIWRESLSHSSPPTCMMAHNSLFQGEEVRCSAFGARVMINALFMEVWYHKRSPKALQDVLTEHKLRLALETWERSLSSSKLDHAAGSFCASTNSEYPLIFNAMAMFRNTRARIEIDLKSVQEAFRYHDHYEVAHAMSNATIKVKRSDEMLKVIQECYNTVELVVMHGVNRSTRTSSMDWSIEHSVCSFDLIVILSLWLYHLEHDEELATKEEWAMYEKVHRLFGNGSTATYDSKVSYTVAHVWGNLLDEVVVWGITRLMGESFQLHAQALVGFENEGKGSSGVSTPSMISAHENDESVY